MSLDAVKILEINVTISPKKKILEEIRKYLQKVPSSKSKVARKDRKPLVITTPNPEQVVYARGDRRFRDILNRADVALPDGTGLVWATRLLGLQSTVRNLQPIHGVDFMESLISLGAKEGVPIALIGGRQRLAVKTFDCLSKKHPGVRGWAIDGPELAVQNPTNTTNPTNAGNHVAIQQLTHAQSERYFTDLSQRIIQSKVGMVFVGLGAPKQEYVIDQLVRVMSKDSHHPSLITHPLTLMSVGGSFDEIAGRLPRAPGWMSAVGLKWLWRLLLEPWRIKRQLALGQFVWLVLRNRLSQRST